jgi:hypothetical protein
VISTRSSPPHYRQATSERIGLIYFFFHYPYLFIYNKNKPISIQSYTVQLLIIARSGATRQSQAVWQSIHQDGQA